MSHEIRGVFDTLRATVIRQIQSPESRRRLTPNPSVTVDAPVGGFRLANPGAARRLA